MLEPVLTNVVGAGLLAAFEGVLIIIALIVAPRGRRPSSALAWILLIVLLPLIGIVLFAIIGSPKLPQSHREKQQHIDTLIEERTRDTEIAGQVVGAPGWLPSVARLNQTVGALPLLEDNHAHLLTSFDDQVSALIAAVDAAQRYVHVEFYILLRPQHRPVLRRLGPGAAAWGASARAAGPYGLARLPGLPQGPQGTRPDGDRVAADAAGPALPWPLPTARPA